MFFFIPWLSRRKNAKHARFRGKHLERTDDCFRASLPTSNAKWRRSERLKKKDFLPSWSCFKNKLLLKIVPLSSWYFDYLRNVLLIVMDMSGNGRSKPCLHLSSYLTKNVSVAYCEWILVLWNQDLNPCNLLLTFGLGICRVVPCNSHLLKTAALALLAQTPGRDSNLVGRDRPGSKSPRLQTRSDTHTLFSKVRASEAILTSFLSSMDQYINNDTWLAI